MDLSQNSVAFTDCIQLKLFDLILINSDYEI